MSLNEIIVSIESFRSQDKRDIIDSNIQYITKLFQNHIGEDKISENGLKSYYIDYYLSHIKYNGFSEFVKNFSNKPKILYYIRTGLEVLKTKKHLELFQKALDKESNLDYDSLDEEFKLIQKDENLVHLNHKWLINYPQLVIVNSDYIDKKVIEHVNRYSKDKRHIRIIKQLCDIIDEEFIGITAGDINNVYNKAWHFKTAQGYYYMVEKNNRVTLFDGFTKQEITRGRVIANKSNFLSKILA